MNKHFAEVFDYVYPVVKEQLSHQQTVTRLYRNILRTNLDFSVTREQYISKCQATHDLFRENQHVPKTQAKGLIEEGLIWLRENVHPKPYTRNYMPGGSKYMRNPTPPVELQYHGEEIPEGAYTGTNTPMHLDSIPISIRPENQPHIPQPKRRPRQ